MPEQAAAGKIEPLDDYVAKHSEAYGLDALNPNMKEGLTYDGKLYALPMQAQMFVMVYRKDVFDKLGLQPPKTFADMQDAAAKIQADGQIKYPIALPWLASADIVTSYDSIMGSLGKDLTNHDTKVANLDSPESIEALNTMKSLLPYMDPQVTTFDQPAVQQQLYNGNAAMAIMFSGRMNDLTLEQNSQFAKDFAFAAPPSVKDGGVLYNTLSIDGWSIPKNAKTDKDSLFQMIASAVSEDASKAAVPAAYPAREGMVSDDSSPYAKAANESIKNVPPAEPYPYTSKISNAITPIIASVVLGNVTPEAGAQQMQAAATPILAEYK